MIVLSSETYSIRNHVLKVIDKLILDSPAHELKVLDVGGGINNWLGERVTHVIDNQLNASKSKFYFGDVNEPAVWENFSDNEFDFVSCTHTLEDIRNPGFVVEQMSRIGKKGFIATPSRFIENSYIESYFWKGYSHHRWIFRLNSNSKIEAICKFPGISGRDGIRRCISRFRFRTLDLFLKKYFRKLYYPSSGIYRNLNPFDSEFGVLWENEIGFQYFEGDFAGISTHVLLENFERFMSDTK